MDQEEYNRVLKKRKAARGLVTRVVNAIEEALSEENVDLETLEDLLEQLIEKNDALKQLDPIIIDNIDEELLEDEYIAVSERQDIVRLRRKQAERKIKELRENIIRTARREEHPEVRTRETFYDAPFTHEEERRNEEESPISTVIIPSAASQTATANNTQRPNSQQTIPTPNFVNQVPVQPFAKLPSLNIEQYDGEPGEWLKFKEQLFMTLCKLRVGLLNRDLAFRFEVSLSTISNYITTWLDLQYAKLTIIPIWASRQVVDQNMIPEFKEKFPYTIVIIDCTEFFIERPSDYSTQCDTYSNYKRHTTAKGLIGIAPNGFVSFVAPLAPGRESGTELTAKSGLIELLDEGDSCMADRGFLIQDILVAKGVNLNIPPFLGDRAQLSETDEQHTRDIASVRIHVERVLKE